MTAGTTLGIDVGGTSIKALLTDSVGTTLGEWREPTPRDDASGERTVEIVERLVATANTIRTVDAVGVVVPGIVDDDRGVVIEAVNLGWRDLPVRDMLEARLEIPVAFGHDVRAGALAESLAGGRIKGRIVFVPIGTGLAGALVVDGVPMSRHVWPGEFGQDLIAEGPHTGLRLEDVVSAGGIARRAGEPNALAVAERVRAGDPAAVAIWNDAVEALADALVAISTVVSPDVIVLGGGLAASGSLLLEPLEAALTRRLGPRRPAMRVAVHGESAAVVGAIQLARGLREDTPR